MRITADTNLLVRVLTGDDPGQAALAEAELSRAEQVALPSVALCELVWVLARGFGIEPADIGVALHKLIAAANVVADRAAVEAGLASLSAGGDFADGVIAYQGAWLGAEEFVSFDRRAVSLLAAQGRRARLLE